MTTMMTIIRTTEDGNGNILSTENIQVPDQRPAMAQDFLDKSEITISRITEAVSLGKTTLLATDVVAFMQYRANLRSIIEADKNGNALPDMPIKPPYPEGT